MNIEKFRKKNNLSSEDVINLLKGEFPKFSHSPLSMVKNKTYGVVLAPKAVRILNDAYPSNKPNRKKGHQFTVRVGEFLYADIMEECAFRKLTVQDFLETLLNLYFSKPWEET